MLRPLGMAIVIGAVCYQVVLCLVNTHVFPASRPLVGLAEAMLMLACLPLLLPRLLPGVVILASLTGAMLCLLALFRGGLDVKGFRDVLIPIWFFWLGRNLGDVRLADRILKITVAVVLVVGFYELFALDSFTETLDIFGYYVNIGSLQPITEYERDSRLQMNGIRPEDMGRTLLPWLLDNHRVSSVFLEPVSLGNFATLVAAWGLSKGRDERALTWLFLGAGVVMMVMADSRFALLSVSLLVFVRLVFRGWMLYLPAAMPFLIMAALVALGSFSDIGYSDTFVGRLVASAWGLMSFDAAMLMGADGNAWFPDQGYAHLLSSFGIVLVLGFWLTIWMMPVPDERAARFRCFAAIYISLILTVSGTSLFAMKTSALLWFLFGTVLADPFRLPVPRHLRAGWTGWGGFTAYRKEADA
ncbi:polysaccharide biosynthesis protein GumE [Marinobacter sp. LN3S78]|uniref:polysaccharide biosynthesis protein GumE n=1 Tax=Marinobacter sp. LN3S78 TaxID=3382300 RepID=UPI00387AA3D1